ncbi:condensin complex subunit SMC2 [Crucibulum laeve]|uniref:Condensin complex subunit SMC2 n=1 Tax=Crucibulum laeve TaxID=68775 RepID=A0A5C3M205_9AGAR|nr:condensin complex subunit SMC2 [Crucibulum laeve]
MRIEELIIEGFKSYPVRTQITGWDPSFNAITGLNGSGKSNILDAICFVLGITNMATMRAANQQDLIYKRGQAGVTKASVTIVFDNSDRSKSMLGLEEYKQVTVTRQIALGNVTKYLLNGHKTNQANIQTLFQSVQLNINNPNFVIMQGRITKVLNMRPQEILGMIEEAAGTRMFEERKDKAKKTMGKKEKRVQEITSLLEEEITPKLEKLRAEKRSFMEYQKSVTELERIGRVLRAFEWSEAQMRVVKKEEEIEGKKAEVAHVEQEKKRITRECEAAENDVQTVTKKRDAEMSKGGKLKKLQDEVDELGKEVVKVRTQEEIKEGTIADEQKKLETMEEELQQSEEALAEKRVLVEDLNVKYTTIKDTHTTKSNAMSTDEELLQTLLTGLSSTGAKNTGGGYMGQLADAKARVSQGAAEQEQSKKKLQMKEKELNTLEARWTEFEREDRESRKKMENMKAAVEALRAKVAASGWNVEKEKEGDTKLKETKGAVRSLAEKCDRVKHQLGRLNFDYSDPVPNFDRRKVKGFAASLISLPEVHYNKATALEIAAGGKLFQVVVEDEHVGKDLIKNGRLKKRVTLIPLNKINAFTLSAQKLNAAERLAPGKVRPALSLVGYPHEVAKAMAYIFSDTLVCDDAESAKKVTFSRDVGVRSVTLDGDVYDPSGTLSGGSAPSGSGILIEVQQLLQVQGELANAQKDLDALEKEERRVQIVRDNWRELTRQLDLKEHEMNLLQQQVEGSNAARLAAQVAEAKQAIVDLTAAVTEARQKQLDAQDECKKLERDMDEFKNNKEGKIDELKANISKQKTALQKHAVIVKTKQKELQTATLELEAAEGTCQAERTSQTERADAKLRDELATLSRFDTELKELDRAIKEKKAAVSQADLDLKQLVHDIQELSKEKTAAVNKVANLEKQYDWIEEDKHLFGKKGTQYDFAAVDVGRLRDKSTELAESQKGMKKKINPKVMNMIDNDFGGIFAELLPGNFAKLQPPDGQDLMQGLEVKVQLGSVWKQSLTELSGGQRSLIALSLIMALLQFKPAPMYILDEIDAALDLSHTQHIGQLFRTRFKGSQFIVVSLKEGLFTNANVLFRARFRDGTSIVERTAQRSTSALYNDRDDEDEDGRNPRRGRRIAGS